MRALLVEDEFLVADAIKVIMERSGYHVDHVGDGESAIEAIHSTAFDIIILDLGLPKADGLSVLKELRKTGAGVPVIILTAREAIENRIEGLDLGADDYLTKPFDMDELLARCRALIRRANGRATPMLEHGPIAVNPASQTATYEGRRVELSPLAFQVLSVLLERKGRVVSKDDLAEVLYGWDESAESNTVEVYVSQVRRAFFPKLIRTIRGVGYIIDKE
ncbi:response regulator transcription factor [Rhodobacteraceae bacterium RKSG542]|uniref:response regulator transcription factor n=1 Tax=Pseudovibrio flavus TaxID=2529854 RepID=UPI0012BC4C82|nr:response regulator transcription factor [Pseudovibrio flavus]MTI16477.1 response regulator transcription factor [Pseudovibrio flavus]